jgi:hypothetical protein
MRRAPRALLLRRSARVAYVGRTAVIRAAVTAAGIGEQEPATMFVHGRAAAGREGIAP